MNHLVHLLASLSLVSPTIAQCVCPTGALQRQHDQLVRCPTGQQVLTVIRGFCVGDKAAAVFDLRGIPGPITIRRGGILFAGPLGSQPATGTLELYDGVTITPTGTAAPGPLLRRDGPHQLALNTLSTVDVSTHNLVVSSGVLMVAWRMDTNPNGDCFFGYNASFASDNTGPISPCRTRPGTNLIFDSNQGWWDITRFQIGGQNWCGPAFNGNWIIRACVSLPANAYRGTVEDIELQSGVGPDPLTLAVAKSAAGNEQVTLGADSPNATFRGSPAVLLVDGFATAGPPLSPIALGLHVSPQVIIVPIALPLVNLGVIAPPNAFGLTFMFQVAAVDPRARNGLFAASDAHAVLMH